MLRMLTMRVALLMSMHAAGYVRLLQNLVLVYWMNLHMHVPNNCTAAMHDRCLSVITEWDVNNPEHIAWNVTCYASRSELMLKQHMCKPNARFKAMHASVALRHPAVSVAAC